MPPFRHSLPKLRISIALGSAALLLILTGILLPHSARPESANAQQSVPQTQPQEPQPRQPQAAPSQEPSAQEPPAPASHYDKAIFQDPIPGDQLAFLNQFAGKASKDLIRDKEFRKLLLRSVIPNCTFHYGHDMPLSDAIDEVIKGSPQPVQIRDGRYLTVSGLKGPYLAGRGVIWLDLQDGIGLGGFYFRPTNGEPSPTVNIFSRQVSADSLAMSQLPPAFYQDLLAWSVDSRVPPVTPRYFITGSRKKILLEHDEDYCASVGSIAVALPPACEQMNADAADVDLNSAYYLEQTHHATNATAWMITDADMAEWIQFRENSCRVGPDRVACRIRMTRERTHTVIAPRPVPQSPHK